MAGLFTIRAVEDDALEKLLANDVLDSMTKLELILHQVGVEVVDYLRSLTDEMRAPVKKGEGPRRAHPGHWADRSSQLVNSYVGNAPGDVVRDASGIRLTYGNTAEYAYWVQVHEGFYVVPEADEQNGVIEQAFRRIAAVLAPEMTVVIGGVQAT